MQSYSFIRGTKTLPLNLSAGSNGSGILKRYVDGSLFGVHPIMRGHTGGGLSMGRRGFPITSSTKQKINTRSSPESELVTTMAVDDDCTPAICWITRYYLLEQAEGK
jgi:hypothetical protein